MVEEESEYCAQHAEGMVRFFDNKCDDNDNDDDGDDDDADDVNGVDDHDDLNDYEYCAQHDKDILGNNKDDHNNEADHGHDD